MAAKAAALLKSKSAPKILSTPKISNKPKVPITLLTGFLGSGKTTTLNHLLTAQHGKKLAVIENEFGEIGLDEALVKQKTQLTGALEENYCVELMNGCICCSVRQDLAAAVNKMIEMHKSGERHVRFDMQKCL